MMADLFPYALLVAAGVGAVVVVWTTVSSVRNRRRRGRRGKLGPAERSPGPRQPNPHAARDQPDPQGWTWLNGPP
jgi:hypothetical protein